MEIDTLLILIPAFLCIAFLYASVGHAGASGYLAVMALVSLPVTMIKPISLVLNIVVSLIASYTFIRAGRFDRRLFFTFVISSMPMAFLGGYLQLDKDVFKILAGIFLLLSAALLIGKQYFTQASEIRRVHLVTGLIAGAIIGLLSGLLGVGGGIFLSPLIILFGWTDVRKAAGVAALFILCNSILGLAGHTLSLHMIPTAIIYCILAVAIGGFAGAHFGSRSMNNRVIVFLLFLVLVTAGVKFLWIG
jgi:uncharacterized protein